MAVLLSSSDITNSFDTVFGIVISIILSAILVDVDTRLNVDVEQLFPHLGQKCHELDSSEAWHEGQLLSLPKALLLLFSLLCLELRFLDL